MGKLPIFSLIITGIYCCRFPVVKDLIVDYAEWRNMDSIVVAPEFLLPKDTVRDLSTGNLRVSFRADLKFPQNGGMVWLATADPGSALQNISDGSSPLLIIVDDGFLFFDKIQNVTFRLDVDLVIAIDMNSTRPKSNSTIEECIVNETLPLDLNQTLITHDYCLIQLYKIRKDDDASMVTYPLGLWNSQMGTSGLKMFLPIEKRINFRKFHLRFGKKDTAQALTSLVDVIEDDSDEEKLIEIAHCFELFFNATIEITYFQKLGYKENGGEWTDLLRAVIDEDVDMALERIIKTQERFHDMAFTHKILKSMRNLYFKPQESNELRNIFLAPFSTRLITCVMAIGAIFTLMMFLTNKLISLKNGGLADAAIWCIGIFAMQGSLWNPKTYSGNIIMLISLLFSIIIFNSYSAFITSILSVEVANIRSVDELLNSGYNIGYTRNSQDEVFLRSMNDSQLQQIYLRGYVHNAVSDVKAGLLKSIQGHYGFFASVNLARKELQVINNYKCNNDIVEIQMPVTKNTIAFPLSKTSPYKKIINLGITKLYETGLFKHIHSTIVPDLVNCDKKRIFRSAHLPDLISAFAILFLGIQLSLIVVVMECLWVKRREIYVKMQQPHIFHRHS